MDSINPVLPLSLAWSNSNRTQWANRHSPFSDSADAGFRGETERKRAGEQEVWRGIWENQRGAENYNLLSFVWSSLLVSHIQLSYTRQQWACRAAFGCSRDVTARTEHWAFCCSVMPYSIIILLQPLAGPHCPSVPVLNKGKGRVGLNVKSHSQRNQQSTNNLGRHWSESLPNTKLPCLGQLLWYLYLPVFVCHLWPTCFNSVTALTNIDMTGSLDLTWQYTVSKRVHLNPALH